MHVEELPSTAAVARRAADLVQATVAAEPEAVLILPAGRTPVPTYTELVQRARTGELDLSRAYVFQLDELVGVGPDDPRSFHAFLRAHLLDHVERAEGRDHLLDGTARDPDDELARHAARLAALGGATLALLGLGRNGHVAFNEPGSALGDGARTLDLAPATRDALATAFGGTPPALGMTLGLTEIAAAREIALLVTGASKAAVLERLVREPPAPELPASLLAGARLRIVADEEAASAL